MCCDKDREVGEETRLLLLVAVLTAVSFKVLLKPQEKEAGFPDPC